MSHYDGALHAALRRLFEIWRSRFGLYLASWFLLMFGTWLIYNLDPLLMLNAYGIGAGASSLYDAVGATLGVFAYAPSGSAGTRIGDDRVVLFGAVMTLLSVIGMAVLAFVDTGYNAWLIPAVFALTPIAWSPLIVAGTAVTAQLAVPQGVPEGAAIGVYNATTAIASVLSALAAGVIADQTSYGVVLIVAAATTGAGCLLFLPVIQKRPSAEPAT